MTSKTKAEDTVAQLRPLIAAGCHSSPAKDAWSPTEREYTTPSTTTINAAGNASTRAPARTISPMREAIRI